MSDTSDTSDTSYTSDTSTHTNTQCVSAFHDCDMCITIACKATDTVDLYIGKAVSSMSF